MGDKYIKKSPVVSDFVMGSMISSSILCYMFFIKCLVDPEMKWLYLSGIHAFGFVFGFLIRKDMVKNNTWVGVYE